MSAEDPESNSPACFWCGACRCVFPVEQGRSRSWYLVYSATHEQRQRRVRPSRGVQRSFLADLLASLLQALQSGLSVPGEALREADAASVLGGHLFPSGVGLFGRAVSSTVRQGQVSYPWWECNHWRVLRHQNRRILGEHGINVVRAAHLRGSLLPVLQLASILALAAEVAGVHLALFFLPCCSLCASAMTCMSRHMELAR